MRPQLGDTLNPIDLIVCSNQTAPCNRPVHVDTCNRSNRVHILADHATVQLHHPLWQVLQLRSGWRTSWTILCHTHMNQTHYHCSCHCTAYTKIYKHLPHHPTKSCVALSWACINHYWNLFIALETPAGKEAMFPSSWRRSNINLCCASWKRSCIKHLQIRASYLWSSQYMHVMDLPPSHLIQWYFHTSAIIVSS